MIRRRLCLGAAAIALTVPLAGCVTVHGERALIPSIRPAEAAKVLADFAAQNNKATRSYDQQAIDAVEAGPLGAIDQAGVRAKHANNPDGNKGYSALEFSDARYFVPEQRGWPKFFVAEARTNRNGDARWLLAFRRSGPGRPWMADFLGVAASDALPDFALDKDGHAEAVPLAGTDLLVQPGQLSAQYASYLDGGTGGGKDDGKNGAAAAGVFADGPATSGLKDSRAKSARTASTVTQYADQPDVSGDFAPVALRTTDGGAVVFFGSRHQSRATFRADHPLTLDADTKALTTGTPRTSITLSRVAQSMVEVPPRKAGTKVVFVSYLTGLVSAKGE
ncbi:hypothetical protein RVR_2593 [Actinacidiphila reveromycinica]|uniref:DUF8094 domain-containing protein n=1 Tax=Actinacidiphila reveromycinica TaxID=659352 RepID=A0A7U3UQS9_9ACTN|nr:hypothetical protein [Streptomyces sp. SN-593]BBA97034.1 hypothetical protein RVR_2593 [Streptomyces sp. SN-593]